MDQAELNRLVQEVLEGDMASVAHAISLVENRDEIYKTLMERIYPESGSSTIIGVTGPPGAGKSTLVNQLVTSYSDQSNRLGVIAVDPSSPYSGGSVLGDRIRFAEEEETNNVFFRSMSAGDVSGGLAGSTNDAVRILEAAEHDPIFIETVGAGQNEVDIVRTADIVLVVLMPKSGDEIQTLKAGILEIGDIFVVNKMDLDGADQTVLNLKRMLRQKQKEEVNLSGQTQGSIGDPIVIKTNARAGGNLDELHEQITHEIQSLKESGQLEERRLRRVCDDLRRILREEVNTYVDRLISSKGGLETLGKSILTTDDNPYGLVDELTQGLDME